jgi:hypothetical protein
MTLLLVVASVWLALCVIGLVGASALCRSGHLEDEARGFLEPEHSPYPEQQRRLAPEVTHK